MGSIFNVAKLTSNLFRTRMAVSQSIQGMTEINPALWRQKEVLKGIIKEKMEQASKSELVRKMRLAKLYYSSEMSPPRSYSDLQKIYQDLLIFKEFMQTGCYKYLTVKQAWLLFLVGLEISMWFYLGETIGKLHIVGYKV